MAAAFGSISEKADPALAIRSHIPGQVLAEQLVCHKYLESLRLFHYGDHRHENVFGFPSRDGSPKWS